MQEDYRVAPSAKYAITGFLISLFERYNPDPETNPDYRLFLEDEEKWHEIHNHPKRGQAHE